MIAVAFADGVGIALAMFAAVFVRLGWEEGVLYFEYHHVALIASWGIFMLALGIGGLYESNLLHRLGRTLAASVLSVGLGALSVATLFYATLSLRVGRGVFVLFAFFVMLTAILMRIIYRTVTGLGIMSERCLIVGTNGAARSVIRLVTEHPHAPIKIVGLVHVGNDARKVGKTVEGYPILGTDENLDQLVKRLQIERLIVAAPAEAEPRLLRRLRSFRYRGVALLDYISLHEELTNEISIEHINEQWLFTASMNNSRFHIRYLKRMFDIFISLVGLVVTSPLLLITAVLIRLDSRGPVLYRQERMGRDGVPFQILKFRSMREDAEKMSGPAWATEDDPRITPLGKWLRKFRIDEIPQLINVLRGEMSLVGPRPEREVFVKQLSEKIPFYAERLLVKPGITGWAQVMYPYTASIEETRHKLQYDLYYIKNMSFFLDLYVIMKTVKIVLFGRERAKQPRTAPSTCAAPPVTGSSLPAPSSKAPASRTTDLAEAHK